MKNKDLLIELLNAIPKMPHDELEDIELINTELLREFAEDRNSTSHIYNEILADEIANRIVNNYVDAIGELVANLEKLK